MTKEELLRIYSACFPFDLEVQHYDPEREKQSICKIVELRQDEMTISNSEHQYECKLDEVMPIFYSLDMLTQPIEHKGETFIPIEKILQIICMQDVYLHSRQILGGKYTINPLTDKDILIECDVKGALIDSSLTVFFNKNKEIESMLFTDKKEPNSTNRHSINQYPIFQKLFEWHFNVFSLPDSAYIKKENLKK